MQPLRNPFHELYLTETISSEAFVDVFSDVLIDHTLELFQSGNVVLRGVGGSGKSMLLNLLRPEVRIAYSKAGESFPVPDAYSRFVGAGINLTRSGAIAFGQRSIEEDADANWDQLPLYFGDFVNYFIVRDVLRSLYKYKEGMHSQGLEHVGIRFDERVTSDFATQLSANPCWSEYLSGVTTFEQLLQRIEQRLVAYRSFFNYNIDSIPEDIKKSKSGIGEPISATAEALWATGVVRADVSFYIRIDQYEQLLEIQGSSPDRHLGALYAATINRLLGARDSRVSYRIGTRHYAWRQPNLQIYGTTSVLERERNYRDIDLDDILRRSESSPGLFPRFAEDVFRRRVVHSGYQRLPEKTSYLRAIFGRDMPPEEKVGHYARNGRGSIIGSEDDWPDETTRLLTQLSKENPLSAKLGEAWVRQQTRRQRQVMPTSEHLPWDDKPYWKKERIQLAAMQIAASRAQRMIWAGEKDLLALSGGNVLVFVSICQHIWGAWMRSIRGEPGCTDRTAPRIDPLVQSEGIQLASHDWHEKLTELPGGHERQRFIDLLGRILRDQMLKDRAMSSPGANGFSLKLSDLEQDQKVKRFLENSVDYAALYDRLHTTRNKDRERRRKWYLSPVLSPYFQLPVAHTKEPIYVDCTTVREWLVEAKVFSQNEAAANEKVRARMKQDDAQKKLFE